MTLRRRMESDRTARARAPRPGGARASSWAGRNLETTSGGGPEGEGSVTSAPVAAAPRQALM